MTQSKYLVSFLQNICQRHSIFNRGGGVENFNILSLCNQISTTTFHLRFELLVPLNLKMLPSRLEHMRISGNEPSSVILRQIVVSKVENIDPKCSGFEIDDSIGECQCCWTIGTRGHM